MAKKIPMIGLDVGSRTLKVCRAEDSKKGFKITRFGMKDIPSGLIDDGMVKDHQAVAEAIRELFKVHKVKERHVAVSIGGYSIIIKVISLQSMPEEELQETIQFEAEQYIPFDISDVNLDFQILGEDLDNPNQMNVLLVAAKKEIVEDYANLIQMAGLIPTVIDVDAFALQNIYEINYNPESENVALIDIGASKTTLNILKGNLSVLIRDVPMGCGKINEQIISRVGCSLDEAEASYNSVQSKGSKEAKEIVSTVAVDWCAEIRRVLDYFYSTYPSDQINRILLSGGGANIQRFSQLLKEETSIDVVVLNPFTNFITGDFDSAYLDRIAPQSAICLGLALRRVDDK